MGQILHIYALYLVGTVLFALKKKKKPNEKAFSFHKTRDSYLLSPLLSSTS